MRGTSSRHIVMKAVIKNRNLYVAILAETLLSICACHKSAELPIPPEKSSVPDAISVAVRPVEVRAIRRTLSALGRCEALPQKQAILTAIIEGRVARVLAELGQEVVVDRPIIQLDTTLARADLAEKQATRDSLIASLNALQSKPRTEEQLAAKIAVEQADVSLHRAEAQLARLRPLQERNEIADAQVLEAEESVKQARLQKGAVQAQLDALVLSPRPETIEEAKSKIKVADAAVNTAVARVALHTITAPISGVVSNVNCRIGQTVSIGTTLAEITDNRKVLVICWVSTKWREVLPLGGTANIQIRLPPSEQKNRSDSLIAVSGHIVFVGKNADSQTGNIPVHVVVDNHDGKLLIGQTLSVNILIEGSAKTTCVHMAAVHDEEDGPTLRVVRADKAVILHPTLGPNDSEWVEVSNIDLKSGDLVIVSGGYNLPDGTLVKIEAQAEAAQSASDTSTKNSAE